MRVLVTGGAGFIGANLCRALAAAGHQPVVLDDLSTGSKENLASVPVELVVGSILDVATVDEVVRETDSVVHLAARASVPRSLADPVAAHAVNATGTIAVLDAVRRATTRPHVIVASSSSVYGANPTLPKHEGLMVAPISPYAASKLAAEAAALAYQRSFDVPVLALRFFNVFGPLQDAGHAYAAVVPAFVSAALEGRPIVVHGDGHQTRDFTFVGTVIAVLVDALTRGVTDAEPVNLAFGTRTEILDLARLVIEIAGVHVPIEHADPRPGDVRDSQADPARLLARFPGVDPVPLDEGVRATVEWYRGARTGQDAVGAQ
jgi:UDP-glucose 4-epimerase